MIGCGSYEKLTREAKTHTGRVTSYSFEVSLDGPSMCIVFLMLILYPSDQMLILITFGMTVNFTWLTIVFFCVQVNCNAVRGAVVWFLILPSHAHSARLRCSLRGLSCSLGARSHGARAGEGERAADAEHQERPEPQRTLPAVRLWLVWRADGRPKLPCGKEDRMWKLWGAEAWYVLAWSS